MIDLRKLIQDFAVKDGIDRADRDRRRVLLFVAAIQERTVRLTLMGRIAEAEAFAIAAAGLVSEWASRGARLQFPKDLFRDPFKDLRRRTREFAVKWDLDAEFRRAIGA